MGKKYHHYVSNNSANCLTRATRSLEEIYKASEHSEREKIIKGGLAVTGFSLLVRLLIKI